MDYVRAYLRLTSMREFFRGERHAGVVEVGCLCSRREQLQTAFGYVFYWCEAKLKQGLEIRDQFAASQQGVKFTPLRLVHMRNALYTCVTPCAHA